MVRNYALTFGAVNLGLMQGVCLEFATSYMIMAWMAWVPNLLVVEWFMQRRLRAEPIAG